MDDADELQEACGLFGCIATGNSSTYLDVAHIIYMGLIGVQHRGQESAGIVTGKGDGGKFEIHRGMGLVSHVFREEELYQLKGNLGIGHTRYSTAGGSVHQNTQPFVVHCIHGLLAVAHNGELVNARRIREKILEKGVGLSTGSDSELLTQILCMPPPCGEPNGPNWPARIKHMMSLLPTAYSLLVMFDDTIYAVRDPFGNRPLCIGSLFPPSNAEVCLSTSVPVDQDVPTEGWVVSSESCSFTSISARLYKELEPGEIVQITKHGPQSLGIIPRPNASLPAFCIFEYVYFARPDSILEGQMVYNVRIECGRQLAREAPADVDLISCVPESATPAALGFAEQIEKPYVEVLCKNRYIGRTFIQPSVRLRQLAVGKKFGPLTKNFAGKKIVLIDDSIVRGTTIGAIIRMLREAGAREIHIRVASPPLHYPCYMGINIPTSEELIANKLDADQLADSLGATSLVYLSVPGLLTAVQKGINSNGRAIGHCTACLTGNYPVQLEW